VACINEMLKNQVGLPTVPSRNFRAETVQDGKMTAVNGDGGAGGDPLDGSAGDHDSRKPP
jgi:hypothetical protein